MRSFFILILVSVTYLTLSSQNMRCFTYDLAGNRVTKVACAAAIVVNNSSQLPEALQKDVNDSNESQLTDTKLSYDVRVYPLPTSSKMYLLVSGYTSNAKWSIFNTMGRLILNGVNNLDEIDLSTFPSGNYLFKLEENGHLTTKNIVLIND